ncbi:Immunoglobulin A1 protease [Canicola haemoglobinophilus]|uniref:Immunoglobulin A1 protease n=2 Tax=Canicola haemoglobinophilus TaxID=733 RepID=A0A377HTZ1_9PAST|nr:S6 family peptidase [Canicola haemoglobinophilus]STO59768.1 Immunoglobulin A1 protease [Canicola haemoglobinophilus]
MVGNPGRFYPVDQNSDSNWMFLSSNKDEAIKKVLDRYSKYQAFNGFLGETDFSKPNGILNINYAPQREQFLLLSGGTELNGNFTVNTSTVLLSGRPTPHARDHLANRDVEKDDDWISREFNAKEFIVKNDGKFYVGRNVSAMNANITGSGNSTMYPTIKTKKIKKQIGIWLK